MGAKRDQVVKAAVPGKSLGEKNVEVSAWTKPSTGELIVQFESAPGVVNKFILTGAVAIAEVEDIKQSVYVLMHDTFNEGYECLLPVETVNGHKLWLAMYGSGEIVLGDNEIRPDAIYVSEYTRRRVTATVADTEED